MTPEAQPPVWLPTWLRRFAGPLSATTLRTGAGTVAISVALMASNVVITVVLARLAGAEGVGTYSFAMAAAGLLAVPAVLGVSPLVVRTVAAASVEQNWARLRGAVRRANQVVLAGSLVVVVLGALGGLALRTARPGLAAAYALGLLLVPLVALATVRSSALQGLGRVLMARVPEALVQPTVFLVLVGLVSWRGDLTGTVAVALQVTAALVALVLGTVLLTRSLPAQVRTTPPSFDDRLWRRAIGPLLLVNAVGTLTQRVDVLLLGTVRSAQEAGIYSVANRAAGLCAFFLTAAAYPLGPLVARLWAQGKVVELQHTVSRAGRVIVAGSLLVAVPMVVLGRPLLGIFGAEFRTAYVALVLLCAGQVVNAATGIAGLVLIMSGHEREVARAVIVGSVAAVALNVVLVPGLGVNGAAIGTATGTVLVNLVLVQRLRRKTGIASAAWSRS